MTSRGKIQRIKCGDVSIIGRNTQGVRIMGLDAEDSLAVIARVPRDELGDDEESAESESLDQNPDSAKENAEEKSKPESDGIDGEADDSAASDQ